MKLIYIFSLVLLFLSNKCLSFANDSFTYPIKTIEADKISFCCDGSPFYRWSAEFYKGSNTIVISLNHKSILFMDIQKNKIIKEIKMNGFNLKNFSLSPDYKYMTLYAEEDKKDGKEMCLLYEIKKNIFIKIMDIEHFMSIDYSNDGDYISITNYNDLYLYNTKTKKISLRLKNIIDDYMPKYFACCSGKNKYFYISEPLPSLREVKTGKKVRDIKDSNYPGIKAIFSRDYKYMLAIGSLYELKTMKKMMKIEKAQTCRFSLDSKYFACDYSKGNINQVLIYSIKDKSKIKTLVPKLKGFDMFTNLVNIDYSPDGKYILGLYNDAKRSINIWKIK